jgi:hypothetical protein
LEQLATSTRETGSDIKVFARHSQHYICILIVLGLVKKNLDTVDGLIAGDVRAS